MDDEVGAKTVSKKTEAVSVLVLGEDTRSFLSVIRSLGEDGLITLLYYEGKEKERGRGKITRGKYMKEKQIIRRGKIKKERLNSWSKEGKSK